MACLLTDWQTSFRYAAVGAADLFDGIAHGFGCGGAFAIMQQVQMRSC
jgi:hypothetical protein